MKWETGAVAALAVLALQACAPKPPAPPPAPKPADGFLQAADQAFVTAAWAKVAGTYENPAKVQYRSLTISEDAEGRGLCGDSAEPGHLWRGFVAWRPAGKAHYEVLRQRDDISARAMAACKPLIRKYMGETGVDSPEIQQAIVQNGCAYIDEEFWRAHKKRCYGTLTVAGGVPTPAPPP